MLRIIKRARWRVKQYRRLKRLLFPSPGEAWWAAHMGCRVYTLSYIKNAKGYPLRVIVPGGWYKANYIEREIFVRGYCIDFGNRRQRLGIEIDGADHDIVKDVVRDEHLGKSKWLVRRIRAGRVIPGSREYNSQRVIDESKKWFE